MAATLDAFSPVRRDLLVALKGSGPHSIGELSRRLRVSREAVRQQLAQLVREGWVAREVDRSGAPRPGRPKGLYRLSRAGDHLFPKRYDDLAVELVDALAERLGPAAVKQVLAALTEARIRRWLPALEGLPLAERLAALKGIYLEDDPFTRVEETPEGGLRLVERNCPFLEVARRRPALCSVTVSTLSRLLGYEVVREERFQAGDGCCAFRVRTDRPLPDDAPAFDWEPEEGADGPA